MRFVPLGQEEEEQSSYTFVPLAREEQAEPAQPSFMDRFKSTVDSSLNTLADEKLTPALGATLNSLRGRVKQESVLQDAVIEDRSFDPAEADRLSRRDYAQQQDMLKAQKGAPVFRKDDGTSLKASDKGIIGRATDMAESQFRGATEGLTMAGADVLSTVGALDAASTLRKSALGNRQISKNLDAGIQSRNVADAVDPTLNGLEKFAGEYAPQVLAQLPQIGVAMLSGGITFPAVLSGLGSYADARERGLAPFEATQYAVAMGGMEAVGEKLGGMDKLAGAFEDALTKGFTKNAVQELGAKAFKAGIMEVPSEELTYVGQTGLSNLYDVNPVKTFGEFAKGAVDTAIVSAGTGGVIGGAGAIAARASQPRSPQELLERSLAAELSGNTFAPQDFVSTLNPNLTAQPQMRNFSDPNSPASQAGITPVVVPITPNPNAQVPNVSNPNVSGGLADGAGTGGVDLAVPSVGNAGFDAANPAGRVDPVSGLATTIGPSGESVPLGGAQPTADLAVNPAVADAGIPTSGKTPESIAPIATETVAPTATNPIGRTSDASLLSRLPMEVDEVDAATPVTSVEQAPAATLMGRSGTGFATQGDAVMAQQLETKKNPDLSFKVEPVEGGRFRVAGYAKTTALPVATSIPGGTQTASLTTAAPEAAIATTAIPAASTATPSPASTAAAPASTLMGAQGTGFTTQPQANAALIEGRKRQPELNWTVDPIDGGRFRVSGYAAQGAPNVTTTSVFNPPAANAQGTSGSGNAGQAVTGGVPGVANNAGRAVSPTVAGNARDTVAARATAQVELDRAHQEDPLTYPKVTLGEPTAESEEQMGQASIGLTSLFGIKQPIVAFSDPSPDSANGFEHKGVVYLNTKGITNNALRTGWHESHHVLQGIAEADDAAGRTDTPAQKYRNKVDAIFDTMSEPQKRIYIESFLYAGRLKGLKGQARETAIQEMLTAPLTRREMMADFVGNRGTDREFIGMLAKADPKGFEAFAKQWLELINNLINTLRGSGGSSASKNVDKAVADLNKAKMILRDAMVELKNNGVPATSATGSTEAALSRKGVYAEVAPDPRDTGKKAAWDQLTGSKQSAITQKVMSDLFARVAKGMGLKGWSIEYTTGMFEKGVNPSAFIEAPAGTPAELLSEVARVMGYLLDQKGMVAFDENNTTSESQFGFVKVVLPEGMAESRINEVRLAIAAKVPQAEGDTLRSNALVFGNFSEFGSSPISDQQFVDAIAEAVEQIATPDEAFDVTNPQRFHSDYIQPSFDEEYSPTARDGFLEGTRYASNTQTIEAGGDSLRGRSGDVLSRANLKSLADDTDRQISGLVAGPSFSLKGRPSSVGAEGDRTTVRGAIHYGKRAGLNTLAGSSNGTGIKGAEQTRLNAPGTDPRIKNRVYFYLPVEGGVPNPESGLGQHVYTADLEGLYDPLTASKPIRGGGNAFESALLDAGFNGYMNKSQGTIVVLNQDVPVEYLGTSDKLNIVTRKPSDAKLATKTRNEGDSLVRKPTDVEVMQIIKARADVTFAAPSFKLQYGEARVLAAEASTADLVLAEAGSTFKFGEAAYSRKQRINDINDLGSFNLDANDEVDYNPDFTDGMDAKDGAEANFDEAQAQADLQAELAAEQAAFQAKMVARAKMAKLKGPRDVTVAEMQEKGLFPEQAMPFGEVVEDNGSIEISMPTGYPERGSHSIEESGFGWRGSAAGTFTAVDRGMTKDGAVNFIKAQLAQVAIQASGFDLASAYRKGTVLKLAQTWRNLAGKSGMFKLPDAATSKDFATIAKQMGAMSEYTVTQEQYGQDQMIFDFKRNKDGTRFNASLDLRPTSFEACTMGLSGSGDLGTQFYAVASEWARLNNKQFRSASTLSAINTARRTEQATSYALKTGNTTVIIPGAQNRVYGFNIKAQTKEDHDFNLARLLLAGMRNAMEIDPEVRRLRYDPATDAFTTSNGADATATVDAFLKNKDARAFGMGRTTLARAVMTSQIISGGFDASKVTEFKKPIAYSRKQGLDSALSEGWGEPDSMTPQLKEFLGDSKIVNEDGTPKVMYHGTAQDISQFKAKQAGAIFLTDSPVFADEFAGFSAEWMARHYDQVLTPAQVEQAKANAIKTIMGEKLTKMPLRKAMVAEIESGKPTGEAQDAMNEAAAALMPSGPNILSVVVRAENPFDYKIAAHRDDLVAMVVSNTDGQVPFNGGTLGEKQMASKLMGGDWEFIELPEVQQAIRDLGHDSFWVTENGQRNLAVYEPTQIKSVFNNGDYDRENPGLSFSRKEIASDPKLERWAKSIFERTGRMDESKILSEKIPNEAMTLAPSLPFGRDQMVVIDGHALDHASKHKDEGITPEIIGKFGEALRSPRLVAFQSPGQLMVVLPLNANNGMPIVMILKKDEIKGGGRTLKVTRFATTFPKQDSASYFVAEIRKGNRVWLPLEEVSRLRDLLGRANSTQAGDRGSLLTQTLVPSLSRGRDQAVKTFNVLSDAALVKKKAGDKDWAKATEGVEIPDDAEKQLKGVAFARKQPIVRAPGMKDESRFMAVRRTLQDQFIQVRELQDMLTARGGVVGEAQDVYRAEERMHGRSQELLTDFANNQIQPLMDKIAKSKINLDEVSLYAYAKHAKERNAYIKSINPKIGDAGSGMSDVEADNIIQLAQLSGDQALFDGFHQDLMGITATTRRVLLDEGLISQEEYDGWDGLYDNYVPLRGFENVTPEGNPRPGVSRGFSTTGKESIKALGRTSKAGDILENIIRDYERAVIRSEKNAVAKTFLDLALNNPDPDLWEIQPVKVNRSFNKASGMVLMSKSPDTGEDTIAVKVGGQQVRVKIKDPLVLRAMKLAAKDETSQLERILATTLGTYTNLMRNTLTRYNPIFGAINAVRDVQMGAVSVFDELGAEGLKLYTKYYTPSLAASFRKERGKANVANPMDKWLMEMRFAGGTTGGFQMREVSDITDSMRTMMLAAGAAPNTKWEKVRGSRGYQGAAAAMKWLEIIGSTSEDAARVAAYRAAREMGKTPAEAASISKNLTTNFNRKGEWGTTLNSLYLFFNAAVQGSTRVLEALGNPRVQKLMAGITAASMAIALANAGMGDDDDGQAYWDKIPAFEKERNFIFMLPAGIEMEGASQVGTRGRYIKIPMPYGLNVFPVLGNQLADLARYTKDRNQGVGPIKAGANMVSSVFGSFNPFGGGLDITKPVEVGMAIAPTAADLAIQLMTGSNAFGRPVGPEKSPFDDKPDSETFSARQAGGASQYAARWLNSVTGGNEGRAGMIDVMPGTLDNVVRNTTGGLGVFLADTFFNLPVKMLSPVETTNRDIPLWRNFFGQIDEVTDIGLFYDRRAEATKEMKQAQAEMKLGVEVDYSPESVFMQTMGKAAEGYTKAMSALRKEEIRIAADEEMTSPMKKIARRELEVQRASLARDFNTDYVSEKKAMLAGE